MNEREIMSRLIEGGREWINNVQAAHRPQASPFRHGLKAFLGPFFHGTGALDSAKYQAVKVVPSPPAELTALLGVPIDFSQAAARTFKDTILISETWLDTHPDPSNGFTRLAFHELVHVVQYEILGVDRFVQKYVTGLQGGRDYYAIPLEMAAYTLQARFMTAPDEVFSVKELVEKMLPVRY